MAGTAQAFIDAQDYEQKSRPGRKRKQLRRERERQSGAPPKRDLKLEALLPYLHGETGVLVLNSPRSAYALELANEFISKCAQSRTHSASLLDKIAPGLP